MSIITLGPARMGDAPAIAHLSRTLIESDLPWSWTPRRVANLMRHRENFAVIARTEGQLAGFVLAQCGEETVHVALLGVASGHQRKGIGRRLIAWVEETASVAGLFMVRLEVRAINRPARLFYASLGYRETGRAAGYYSGMEDAIRLSRDLRVVSVPR